MTRRSSTATIVHAMRILEDDIKSDDGIANGAIAEAADRIEELVALLSKAAGPMSHERWSTAFRDKVKRAIGGRRR